MTSSRVVPTLMICLCLFAGAVAAEPVIVNLKGQPDAVGNYTGDGKWTLVMVWSTACSACQRETPSVNAYNARNAGGRVHVVGVAINGYTRKAAIEAFREKYDMAFPTLVADPRRFLGHFQAKTGRAFKGTPTFLVYAPDGRLAGVNTGPIDLKRFDAFLDANAG